MTPLASSDVDQIFPTYWNYSFNFFSLTRPPKTQDHSFDLLELFNLTPHYLLILSYSNFTYALPFLHSQPLTSPSAPAFPYEEGWYLSPSGAFPRPTLLSLYLFLCWHPLLGSLSSPKFSSRVNLSPALPLHSSLHQFLMQHLRPGLSFIQAIVLLLVPNTLPILLLSPPLCFFCSA